MGISDRIEAFICELMKDDDGWVELGRNELAGIFNCVPSQINYVMSTRFTPNRGYITESRRGGGGYLRIKRISPIHDEILRSIPNRITKEGACDVLRLLLSLGVIEEKTLSVMKSAVLIDWVDDEKRAELLSVMTKAALS